MSNKLVLGANVVNGAYLGTQPCLFIEHGGKLIAPTFNTEETETNIKKDFILTTGGRYLANKVSFYNGLYFDNSVCGQIEATYFGEIKHCNFFCLQGFNLYHAENYDDDWFIYYCNKMADTQLQLIQVLVVCYVETFKGQLDNNYPLNSVSDIEFIGETNHPHSIEFNFRIKEENWSVSIRENENYFEIRKNWY